MIEHPEYGEVIQLQGDQRKNICQFLMEVKYAYVWNIILLVASCFSLQSLFELVILIALVVVFDYKSNWFKQSLIFILYFADQHREGRAVEGSRILKCCPPLRGFLKDCTSM